MYVLENITPNLFNLDGSVMENIESGTVRTFATNLEEFCFLP